MSQLRNYVEDWNLETKHWRDGWINYEQCPDDYKNPHLKDTEEYNDFATGWNEAQFVHKLDAGYYD